MENFVLNLFSDQLSKVILNFNDAKMKINANFMAGKGSITNVKLNVDLINDFLNKPPHGMLPYLQLSEVTLTQLRLEVTSYTNLKKAPVVLVIDEIHAHAIEPLEYYFDGKNNTQNQNASGANAPSAAYKPQYGLLQRIQDNLSVRVNKINFTFQPLGKFKTRRVGPWTPPSVMVTLKNVEWISVTEMGNIGTPEMVWAHNDLSAQQTRMRKDAAARTSGHQHRTYTIFKRLTMVGSVRLLDANQSEPKAKDVIGRSSRSELSPSSSHSSLESPMLISDCNIEMHVAYLRRLRDAAITGVDVDILCKDADICLDLSPSHSSADRENNSSRPRRCSLQSLIHFMVGLQHAVYKDRSFVDPLLPENSQCPPDGEQMLKEIKRPNLVDEAEKKTEELGPDDFMPTINVEDDDLDESSEDGEEPDEEHDEAFLAWKKEQGLEVEASVADPIDTVFIDNPNGSIRKEGSSHSLRVTFQNNEIDNEAPSKYKRKRKAVIVLARGAQKFEKLSFSLTLRRVSAKLYLPQKQANEMQEQKSVSSDTDIIKSRQTYRNCLELLAEGAVIECIWPKPSGEIGGNVQCSLRYLHIMEAVHRLPGLSSDEPQDGSIVKYSALMRMGTKLVHRDVFSLSSHWNSIMWRGAPDDATLEDDQGFPVMTSRPVSWKWTRSINVSGPSAISLKSTVTFVDENLALWTKTKVVHDASIGKIEVCFDSAPLGRLVEVISSVPSEDRWSSGDWSSDISYNMLAEEVPDGVFSLKNHIQPLPGWSNVKLSALSSDLRSITARFDGFIMRMPHAVNCFPSCGLAEVVVSSSKATLLVSSELPISFLTGTITASDGTSDFPNDPRDISCRDGQIGFGSDTAAKFRLQVTLSDFSLTVMPMQQMHSASNIYHLMAPTKITMITSLEHAHALPQSESRNVSDVSQSFVVSVLIQRLESNIALQIAVSATNTINYHLTAIMRHVQLHSPGTSDDPLCTKSHLAGVTENAPTKTILVVCFHVPELELNMFDDRAHPNVLHLSRLILRQVEFGFESTCDVAVNYGVRLTTLQKCVIEGFAFQVISKEHTLVNFVTTGMGASEVAASLKSFIHNDELKTQSDGNVMIRIQREVSGTSQETSTYAVEISSLVIVSLDVHTIKSFSDFVVSAMSAPVYFYSKPTRSNSFESIAQSTISTLLWSVSEMLALFHSSDASSRETDTAFNRLVLSNLILQVPNTSLSANDAHFWFSFDCTEIAYCYSRSMKEAPDNVLLEQKCGRGDDWRTVLGCATDCNTFYLLKSRLSVLIADGDRYMFAFPTFSMNWNSNTGDIQIKNCIESLLCVSTVVSSSTMKLFYLLPGALSKARMSSPAKELHNMIANYHSKVMTSLFDLEEKVEKMRLSLFVKERERVGMMALALPVASGWLRITERSELSFHRLFATATLFRYWAVLHNSLLILYENPGSSLPTIIFPIIASSTSIRKISIPGPTGIVGTHLQQNGFALIDSASGNELFCVAGSQDEFTMWLSAIAFQLRQDSTAINSPGNEAFALDRPCAKHELAGEVVNNHTPSSTAGTDDYFNGPNISISDESNEDDVNLGTPEDDPMVSHGLLEILTNDPVTGSDTNYIPSIDPELDNDEMETIALDKMELPHTTSPSSSSLNNSPPDPILRSINVCNADLKFNTGPSTYRQEEQLRSVNVQKSLSRDLLKSKFASSKFGSALKTAKGGVLATSEIGRDSLRHALSNDGGAPNNPSTNNEAKSVLAGHKLSALKKTANTKIVQLSATVRSSVQELSSHSAHAQRAFTATSSHVLFHSHDSISNSAENSGHEAALGPLNLTDSSNTSYALNQSTRQDQIRKKFANLDQSMASRMRRLKIDEKLNNIGSLVKNATESRSVNISQSLNSDQRLHKSLKFDARETFESHSVLPVRIKTMKTGSSLKFHDYSSSETSAELTKIQGNWIIDVELTSCVVDTSETEIAVANSASFGSHEGSDFLSELKSVQAGNIRSGSKQQTYRITSTEIGDGSAETVHHVEKTLSDILLFHALISEILSSHYSCAAEVTFQEATEEIDSLNPVFQRMPPLERIKVTGSVLQGILDASKSSIDIPSIRNSHCELIKVFLYTLITSYLPKMALHVTGEFLGISSISIMPVDKGCPAKTTELVNDAFSCICEHTNEIKLSPSMQSHLMANGETSSDFSSVLETMMIAYSRATQERDEALATLAAASILQNNEIALKYVEEDLETLTKPMTSMQHNTDDEMQMLCKNLGQEIRLRTKAEAEVHSLKQQLELERKLASIKQDDLMVELDMCKSLLKTMSSGSKSISRTQQ